MSPEPRATDTVRRIPFEIDPAPGGVIRGDVRCPLERGAAGAARSRPAIVVCHGFKGFKDWGFFPYLSERLATDAGAAVVSFNFSGSGIGPDLENFTDLEGFARNTFSREVEDLETVLRGLEAGRLGEVEVAPTSSLGLIGHSRGAAAAVIAGARHPGVEAVVTWAGIASPFRYESWFEESMGTEGVMHVVNTRTGQRLPLYRDVLDDLRANRDRLDMESAAARLGGALLVIHGADDEAVPVGDARRLHEAAGPGADLAILEGAGHTFGASHPFPGTNPHLEEALTLTSAHFQRLLSESRS